MCGVTNTDASKKAALFYIILFAVYGSGLDIKHARILGTSINNLPFCATFLDFDTQSPT